MTFDEVYKKNSKLYFMNILLSKISLSSLFVHFVPYCTCMYLGFTTSHFSFSCDALRVLKTWTYILSTLHFIVVCPSLPDITFMRVCKEWPNKNVPARPIWGWVLVVKFPTLNLIPRTLTGKFFLGHPVVFMSILIILWFFLLHFHYYFSSFVSIKNFC
jgi:hypothetical protein